MTEQEKQELPLYNLAWCKKQLEGYKKLIPYIIKPEQLNLLLKQEKQVGS